MVNFKYQISTIILLLAAVQITFGQAQKAPENEDVRLENLHSYVDLIVDAQQKNDVEKFVELTHPKVIEKIGGREKFISTVRTIFEQISNFFESYSSTAQKPKSFVEWKDNLFAVVPIRFEGVTNQKIKTVGIDCMVGVSNDNGKTWKFVSGVKFNEVFPDAKGKIPIIKQRIFINGIEQ